MTEKISFDQINEQGEITPLVINFSTIRNKQYCRLDREINPIHFNVDFARKLGYRDIVIAGIFTYSFFPKMLTDYLGPQISIEKMDIRFIEPAYLNETITYKGKVVKKFIEDNVQKIECEGWSENPAGERLTAARITVQFK